MAERIVLWPLGGAAYVALVPVLPGLGWLYGLQGLAATLGLLLRAVFVINLLILAFNLLPTFRAIDLLQTSGYSFLPRAG